MRMDPTCDVRNIDLKGGRELKPCHQTLLTQLPRLQAEGTPPDVPNRSNVHYLSFRVKGRGKRGWVPTA